MPIKSPYGKQNIASLLLRNEVWLSSPADFNDPLECSPVFREDLEPKHFWTRYKWIKQNPSRQGFSSADHRIADAFANMSINKIRRKLTPTFVRTVLQPNLIAAAIDTFTETGVSCFSETAANSAMWAYYADSHEGICISAFVTPDPNVNFALERVEYASTRPTIELSKLVPQNGTWRISTDDIRKFILTKSDHWQHENEVRLLMTREARQSVVLNGLVVDKVILGVRTSSQTEAWIKSIAGQRLTIVRAKFRTDSYDLEVI